MSSKTLPVFLKLSGFQIPEGPVSFALFRSSHSNCASRLIAAIGIILFFKASSLIAADTELTSWKSGIDLNFGNSAGTATDKGTAYAEEYFYYDKVIDDHRVVYIKADTQITMSHNSRNIAGESGGADEYEGVATNVGQIRYKLDGDQYRGGSPLGWTPYTAPVPFSSLNYGLFGGSGTPAVGTTGPTGGDLTEANVSKRYYRGMLDSAGDEWHIITVADDDSAYTTNPEYRASDGKIWYFVVNPKTPCATWRHSGSGQFYTTPPKKYFFPIIYDQTTYFSGTVTCELRDINGNNVFYRINGGSFINAGSSTKTLTDADFSSGNNTLEYYYAGNVANTKTRMVVKNPAYPSAGESHGDRLWKSAALWESEVKPRISADPELKKWRDFWRTNWIWNKENQISAGARRGNRYTAEESFPNAFTARWEGMTFKNSGNTNSAADAAKLALFETKSLLDPIGYEMVAWPEASIPSREMNYRGYYDVQGIYSHAATYDILAGYYRSNQGYANGLTAVQDYFIRDALARWVHLAQLCKAGYAPDGMWPAAHVSGAMVIAGMMPSYSTPYYGTCGLDGNNTVYPWTPFQDANYTWKRLFFVNDIPLNGYPNCKRQLSINDRFTSDGKWKDRISYSDTALFGLCAQVSYNMVKLFSPSTVYPNLDLAMTNAAKEQLYGTTFLNDSDRGPAFRSWASLQNSWFPAFRNVARPNMLSAYYLWPNNESIGKQLQNARAAFALLYYNHNLPLDTSPAPPPPPNTAPVKPTNLRVVEQP